ncbi:hypothetical protein J4216_02710 [Candidatus Woesearchaeota archaeon]|nr:hypothetical protein [Candidatus Woesearchaeota archaeon]
MLLERLKEAVMQQALEKDFGITPQEIDIAEKLILVCSEGVEVRDVETEAQTLLNRAANAGSWYSRNKGPELLKRLEEYDIDVFDTPPAIASSDIAFNRRHYREEWGDVLQRVLHIGGCYGIIFPDLEKPMKVPPPWNDLRYRKLYELAIEAHTHHRKMRKEPDRKILFEKGLIEIAHYCVAISLAEMFDIEKVVMEKIDANKERVWKDYNEKLKK